MEEKERKMMNYDNAWLSDPTRPENIMKMKFEAVKKLVDEKLRSTTDVKEELINEVIRLLDELQGICINAINKSGAY